MFTVNNNNNNNNKKSKKWQGDLRKPQGLYWEVPSEICLDCKTNKETIMHWTNTISKDVPHMLNQFEKLLFFLRVILIKMENTEFEKLFYPLHRRKGRRAVPFCQNLLTTSQPSKQSPTSLSLYVLSPVGWILLKIT